MNETHQLAERVSDVTYEDIPDEAIDHAKRSIRNFVGLTLHGSIHPVGETVGSYLEALGVEGDATIIGRGSADPTRAAFANGTFGHVLEYDDTFESVVIHPSCTAFPAALATAESVDAAGRDLLTGYVVGADVIFRVGRSVAPTHWQSGWHATATIGVFGATAAAASILGLETEVTERALGLAGSFSSGLKKNIGTQANPIHCGHAAGSGVKAALLAREGAEADNAIFEGEYGYGNVATREGRYDPSDITEPTVEWAILDNALKPYPTGVVVHSAMESLRSILEREDLKPDDVKRITAEVDEGVLDTIDQHDPQNAMAAVVSYEFGLGAILRNRDVGINELTDEYVRDPDTRRAMAKVHLDPRSELFGTAEAEASYGARVTVETVDGRTFEAEMRSAPGGASNPLPEARWIEKFYACAETVLDRSSSEHLSETIDRIDEQGALEELTAIVEQR